MEIWSILIMALVGGFIGWMTNYFAIGMLFRPYEPIKVGKITLPFTPGVIPKRRKEIAHSIGKIVGRDLIHADKIIGQILNDKVKEQVIQMTENMVHQAFQSKYTISMILQEYIGIKAHQIQKVEEWAIKKLQDQSQQLLSYSIKDIVEETAGLNKEGIIEKSAKEIQALLVKAMDEPGFRQVLMDKIEEFMKNLGVIKKMVTQMIQPETIADKVISGIQPYAKSETVYFFICEGVKRTFEKYENQPIGKALEDLGLLKEENIHIMLQEWVQKNNPLHQPIYALLGHMKEEKLLQVMETSINHIFASSYVHEFLHQLIEKIDFEQLVEDEINQLSLPDLEAKIHEIAHRELFMIQILGGVLGFIIGWIQAVLLLYVF